MAVPREGAAESSDESDAPSRDDASMGSGESDASAQATVLSSQVQHAQMRQGTAQGGLYENPILSDSRETRFGLRR